MIIKARAGSSKSTAKPNNGSESEPEDSEDQGEFVPEIADLEAQAREQEAALALDNFAKKEMKKARHRKQEKREAKRKGKKRAAARDKKENDKRANLLKAASKYSRHESTDISESDDEADQNSKLAVVALIKNEKRRKHKEKVRKKINANKQYGHLRACTCKFKQLKCINKTH